MSNIFGGIEELCRVPVGKRIRLADYDTAWSGHNGKLSKDERKKQAQAQLAADIRGLSEAQEMLYASDTWSILVVFQAMDAAGKDSTIKHVMSGLNPQGCQVYSFKHPSAEELDHDFLWRCAKALPERGRIGIFNRSYYEEVLIAKVHPEIVQAQRIPNAKPDEKFWNGRYDTINDFERHLTRNGTKIVKFFLHVSQGEQRQRFLDRLNDADKHWKFSLQDMGERAFWDQYMDAYETALSATSTDWAPWYVLPADHKWVTRALAAKIIVHTIRGLDVKFPELSAEETQELEQARAALEQEGGAKPEVKELGRKKPPLAQ